MVVARLPDPQGNKGGDMETRLQCEDCGWVGLQEDCGISIKATGTVPVCPKCNSENLIELAGRGEEVRMPVLVPA